MDIENFEENNIFFVLVLCLSVYRGMYKRNKEKREREWGGFVMYRIFPMIWRVRVMINSAHDRLQISVLIYLFLHTDNIIIIYGELLFDS